jgi:sugar transferase EpsL
MKQDIYSRCGKRLIDLVLAVPAIIVLAPFLAVVALILRIGHGPGVIYKQPRPGFKGKPFLVYKFRTMVEIHDSEGNLLPDKERLTRLGYWLRRLSIDELPQFWNVLRGELSMVGPRPQLLRYVERCTPEQNRRHDVKPGLTGWAQINGRNSITWEERFRLDVWYVDHACFWLDLKIMWRTIWLVLSQAGISAHGHATMPEFLGTHAHLAVAGSGGNLNASASDVAEYFPVAEDEWSEANGRIAPRRELVSAGEEFRLDHGRDESFGEELLPAFTAARSAVLTASNAHHADAVLVNGTLHGPSYGRHSVNGHVNGHATNGHSRNGIAANGHVEGEDEESAATVADETTAVRKPR